MKNHRFLWLRNRTTNNRKCEKARNIKEKRTIEMFSMDIEPVVSPVCDKVNLCHILLSDVDGEPSAQQLQEYSVLQNAGNIIVPVANNGVAQT